MPEEDTGKLATMGESKAITNSEAESQHAGEVHDPPQGLWAKTRRWIDSVGAEGLGVERITDEMRTNQHPRDLCTLFISGNCNTATLALGYLGPTVYGLGWWDSFLCVLFFNAIGCLFPTMVACFGPKLGLRTMIIPRYCFGWWPAKVLAFLNVINQIGWSMVNSISGASVLYDVGEGQLPLAVCVLILGLFSAVLSLMGYRVLHLYDRYSWIVMLVCFVIVAGFGGKAFINVPMGSGPVEAASVLSFGTAIIGFQLAWLPVTADYGVYLKRDISSWTLFSWTFGGLLSSQLLIELLGVAIGTLSFSSNELFTDAYVDRGIGGLIGVLFDGYGDGVKGFGKFIEVVLSFSTAAVIGSGIYSMGLSVQMISKKWLVVPRLVWSLLGTIVFLACAIAGRENLAAVMSNFLNVCAYWIIPFGTILLLEHFVWRRNYEYDLTAWNDRTKLPYGIAASIAFVVGTVVALLSMSQTWWVGPIAMGVGGTSSGTDISWILAFIVSAALYVPMRWYERQRWGL